MRDVLHKVALVLTVSAGAVCASGCMRTTVQDDVLAFSLTDLDGRPVSLSDERFAGKVVLVELWGTWCPPCIVQMPHLIGWQETYRERGFEVIAIEFASFISGPKEEYDAGLKGYVEKKGVNYTVVQAGETTDVFDVLPTLENFRGFPTSIFIDRDGIVKHVKSGFHESETSYYERTIEELLEEPAAPPN